MRLLPDNQRRRRRQSRARGFTLIELIVVLVIIGLLAAVSLPALKNVRQNNTMVAAGRQLVDDLALARARAISERTTVHVFFVPSEIMSMTFSSDPKDIKLGERLKSGQYTTYALFAERSVGDQPGNPRFRYLTSWKSLPNGVFIATNKLFDSPALWASAIDLERPFEFVEGANLSSGELPFPTIAGANQRLPHVAFDFQGRLVDKTGKFRLGSEVIPLSRGSIIYSRNPDGTIADFDLRESPPGNASDTNSFHIVRIDGLTGRARVETKAIY